MKVIEFGVKNTGPGSYPLHLVKEDGEITLRTLYGDTYGETKIPERFMPLYLGDFAPDLLPKLPDAIAALTSG